MRRPGFALVRPALGGLLLCAAAFAGSLRGGETRGKITGEAAGTISVRPDVAEIRTAVIGNATLAADAVKKFRDNRRRAFEWLNKLEVKGLAVEGRGPLITSVTANNNQQAGGVLVNFNLNVAGQANQQVAGMNCTESLVVRLPQIDRMKDDDVINAIVKVLDKCKDAGMTVASVQFKSTQMETSKSAAVRAAVQAARQKAELLASLSQARVGPVVSIRETSPSPGGLENLAQQAADSDENVAANGLNIQVTSSSPLTAIVVRATVNVEFALERGN
jgi:uncharacterized protein YggE